MTSGAGREFAGRNEIVSQIDHVMFVVPQKQPLAALLVDTLGLPLVWPQPGDTRVATTGIAAGNVNLELAEDTSINRGFLTGVFLQPVDFAALHRQLEARGVGHREPSSWPPPNPAQRRWTTLALEGFGFYTFVIQYHGFDMNERRARYQDTLARRSGGPLGIVRVLEVRRGVSDLGSSRESWNRLLGASDSARWSIGAGPALRLMAGTDTLSTAICFEVVSKGEAAVALRRLQLDFSESGDTLVLNRSRFGGLGIYLLSRNQAP